MSMSNNHCASCGKAAATLKVCKACMTVKYCGVDCQVAHWPAHKKACKKRVAELLDEKLFTQPPQREDCPICMIILPCDDTESFYMSCCGKFICIGCRYCWTREICPFCNTAYDSSNEELIKRLSERVEKYNDPDAMIKLGNFYNEGLNGLSVDQSKAFDLFKRASELGSAAGHYNLGTSYNRGEGTEIDKKKAVHHNQIAAIMGDVYARHNLGYVDIQNGDYQRAMKHTMIAAKCGFKLSLNNVKEGFKQGHVTKEDFEKTLRDYQTACEETKSEQRDRAAVIAAREREYRIAQAMLERMERNC